MKTRTNLKSGAAFVKNTRFKLSIGGLTKAIIVRN